MTEFLKTKSHEKGEIWNPIDIHGETSKIIEKNMEENKKVW